MSNQYKDQHWSASEILCELPYAWSGLEEPIDVDGFFTTIRKLCVAGYHLHVKQKDRYSEHTKIVFSKRGKNCFSTRVRNLKDFASLPEILSAFIEKMNRADGVNFNLVKPRDVKRLDPKTFEPIIKNVADLEKFSEQELLGELHNREWFQIPGTIDKFSDEELLTELSKRSESWAKPRKVVAEPKAPDNIVDFKEVFAKIDKEMEEAA